MPEVALLVVPFAVLYRPSIALGLLQSCLREAGIEARVYYTNLWYADEESIGRYEICDTTNADELVGEWVFSAAAFPGIEVDSEEYYKQVTQISSGRYPRMGETLTGMRNRAGQYIDRAARRVLADGPRIVGCSSTFQQHCASLAILRRIRELDPSVVTVMGGANCEGPMGEVTHREFPWVDFVVSGEADLLFPMLCRRILDSGSGVDVSDLAGVLGPADRGPTLPERSALIRAVVKDMDSLPTPDFDDYFAALKDSKVREKLRPGLIIETSRGCWWGQKNHCTFCGLNGGGMTFRSKSPDRALQEFENLASRYGLNDFSTADNIIEMGYLETVLPKLEADPRPYNLFYETKSNLKRSQVQKMVAAGVHWLQPGIESLHDEVLRLMNKGVTALINVQLLKWTREVGIRVTWNFLWDFPGEKQEWYAEMASWLPLVVHLQPPSYTARIRYDRFSPYHTRPEQYGVVIAPGRFYRYVYPLPEESLNDLAYFFQDAPGTVRNELNGSDAGYVAFHQEVHKWREGFWTGDGPPILSAVDEEGRIQIVDTRPCATQPRHTLEGLARAVYLAAEQARAPRGLVETLAAQGHSVSWDEVGPVVAHLQSHKLLLELGGKVLALAVWGAIPKLPPHTEFPGGATMAKRDLYDALSGNLDRRELAMECAWDD